MAAPTPPPATVEEPTPVSYPLRGRTVSDAMSGMSITRDHATYNAFTQEELETHFARFKQYDLDNTGFVSQANLKAILEALDMPEVSEDHCANMIAEVSILVGHENDGQLSFRDYCALITYENKKRLQDEVVQAHEELRTSMRIDEEPEEEEKPPVGFSPRGLMKSLSSKLSRKSTKEKVPVDKAAVELEEELRVSMRDSQRDSQRDAVAMPVQVGVLSPRSRASRFPNHLNAGSSAGWEQEQENRFGKRRSAGSDAFSPFCGLPFSWPAISPASIPSVPSCTCGPPADVASELFFAER